MTIIWHNPRCSKSRQTLALLNENGIDATIRRYLDEPPTESELMEARRLLGLPTRGLMRPGETLYRELGLADADDEALMEAMAAHPILIERPIVFHRGRAAIGRPPENVLALFD